MLILYSIKYLTCVSLNLGSPSSVHIIWQPIASQNSTWVNKGMTVFLSVCTLGGKIIYPHSFFNFFYLLRYFWYGSLFLMLSQIKLHPKWPEETIKQIEDKIKDPKNIFQIKILFILYITFFICQGKTMLPI